MGNLHEIQMLCLSTSNVHSRLTPYCCHICAFTTILTLGQLWLTKYMNKVKCTEAVTVSSNGNIISEKMPKFNQQQK